MELRDYQLDAVDAVLADWQNVDRTAIEVGVGGGKTIIAAEIIKRTLQANPNAKIVTLAHRRELLKSMQKTVSNHCGVQVGIVDGQVAPAMRKRHLEAQVVCINTATLGISKKARSDAGQRLSAVTELHRTLGNVDLVILDECHRANTDTALDCLTELGCFSGTRLLGMTGTLFRNDDKMLTDVFENCAYRKGIMELIAEGYLSDVVMKQAHVDGMDLNKVGVSRSMSIEDFNATDLDKVMEAAGAEAVIAEFAKRYTGTRKTLVFTPTVNSANRVAHAFKNVGLAATVVHGGMSPSDRADALEQFENGDLQYIINCMIITEGTDLPSCACIIMARPTKSQQLYIQILGRALRLHDDKENALIIDLVGATAVNNLVSASTIFGAEAGETASGAGARIEATKAFVAGVAAAVHAGLDEEDQQEFDMESIVSGSFNLFDVEIQELIEQVKAKAKEKRETRERERVRKLPSFPAPGRCGSMLELDFDFLISLESWSTLPQYKGSYAAIASLGNNMFLPFYCDKSKTFDNGRYGFIGNPVGSFEEAETLVIDYTKIFPGTASAMYYSQNKLQPNHPKRNKKATADQLKFMVKLLKQNKIKLDEVAEMQAKQMKAPSIGVCVDWIDYLLLCSDARRRCSEVKDWYKENK